MFIGHLPAAYIVSEAILGKAGPSGRRKRLPYLLIGIVAGILPDFDMLYFYLVDNRQHLHHSYWTHLPVYWIALTAVLLSFGFAIRNRPVVLATTVGSANIVTHLLLDTIVGKIRWLYPLSDRDFVLFFVPARYNWWVMNFMLHWTVAFELALVAAAAAVAVVVFIKRNKIRKERERNGGAVRR